MKNKYQIQKNEPKKNKWGQDRRDFLKSTAFLGGCAALASQIPSVMSWAQTGGGEFTPGEVSYELAKPENILYSTCLQCHVACPIKAKTWDGVLAKIDGNPYSPQNYLPHLKYDTSPNEAVFADGKLCPKGQSGVETYYDPYRVRKVLKRKGARGSNQWETIEWDQFINEVVSGGKLFENIGDVRHYPGFDEVFALRDLELSKKMAADVGKIRAKEMTVAEFKTKYRQHLDKLIDPDHPDLGPKNNQFVFNIGRAEHGRKELSNYFTFNCMGSQNRFDHFSICEESHHIAFSEMTHHKTHHMKPDLLNSEFVIFWGTGAFTANFGLTPMAEKVTTGKVSRQMKTAVVDPRLSNDAAKADYWMPVKPGTDGALAMSMIRWILENERFDSRYLRNANKAAADEDGEPTWTNATHLVKIIDGRPQKFLRASEVGLGSEEMHVVSRDGKLIGVDYHDENNPVEGDLFIDTTIIGVPVKSGMQLLMEEAFSRTLEEYSEITHVPLKTITDVAREFTSHGKRAAIEFYRGPCQHTDGFYTSTVIIALNLLVGNPDWKGGLSVGGSHWHEFGGKPGNVYNNIKKPAKGMTPFGIRLTRENSGDYETSTLFERDGYPAKRPWYPLATGVYQEVLPSWAMRYPYGAKIMLLHKGTPLLSIPGSGYTDIPKIKDPDVLPLFIASDIVIGESSMFADYILPDLVYLERWGTPHTTPDINSKTSKIRQPVAVPLTEEVEIDGEKMPISMEAFLLAVGKKLNLPGIGEDAFGEGMSFNRPEDFYLKAVANMAYGDKPGEVVPDASDEEMELFRKARRHLPPSVFDEEKWKNAVKEVEWRKVVYVLNRGGRYASFESGYDGKFLKKKIKSMFYFFNESMANRKNSMSGEYFHGYPVYIGQYDSMGNPLKYDEDNYPFRIITYKEPFGGHSRTISNYWGNIGLQPENKIWINTIDARKLGLKQDQKVRVVSPSNPEGKVDLGNGTVLDLVAKVLIKEGIKPGVIAISWHFGHWAYGSNDVEVDGQIIKGDERRKAGICPNPLFQRDPVLKDVVLSCPIGSSTSYYDSVANVVPV